MQLIKKKKGGEKHTVLKLKPFSYSEDHLIHLLLSFLSIGYRIKNRAWVGGGSWGTVQTRWAPQPSKRGLLLRLQKKRAATRVLPLLANTSLETREQIMHAPHASFGDYTLPAHLTCVLPLLSLEG